MVWCGLARAWRTSALWVVILPAACWGRSRTLGIDEADGAVGGRAGDDSTGGTGAASTPGHGGVPNAGGGAAGAEIRGGTTGVAGSAGVPGMAAAGGGAPVGEGGRAGERAGNSGEGATEPASAGEGGTPGCEGGCVCEGWWADCDRIPGCEASLDGPQNCGDCGILAIAYEHTQMNCASVGGNFPICEPGFGDCRLDERDCETSYADAQPSCLPVYLGSLELDRSLDVSIVQLGPGGEIYLAGSFTGTVDFDPGPTSDLVSTNGGSAAFVTKLGADGSYSWTRPFHGMGVAATWGEDIAVGSDGSVLFLGTSVGTADLDSSAESDSLEPPKTAFVVALSTDGEQRWSRSFSSPEGLSGSRISVSESQEAYVLMASEPDGPGYTGVVLAKLDSAGETLWLREGDSGRTVFTSGVAATSNGVAITLGLVASCLLDGFADELSSANPTRAAGLLAGFDTNGAGVASGFFEGEDPRSMAEAHRLLRAGNGSLFVAGFFEGRVDLDPGAVRSSHGRAAEELSSFVARLADDGSFVWAQPLPSFRFEDMTVTDDGSVFVSGHPVNGSGYQVRAFAPNLRSRFTLPFDGLIGPIAADTQRLAVVGYALAGTDIDPSNGVDLSMTDRDFISLFALSAY